MAENEVIAQEVLTRSLLAQHKSREARRVSDRARLRSRRMQNVHVRLSWAITGARVRAAGGEIAQALEDGESVIVEARKVGFFDLQLEARLALGEIEVGSGRTATGVPRLQELEKEATQKGFVLIAHKASAATASRRD